MRTSEAMGLLRLAHAKAIEMDVAMNIAIVDEGANLMAFMRMDDAWLGSIDIAIRKARTARFFDMSTGLLGKASQPGCSLYGIEHSNGGLISFPGGIPVEGGAVGVSGGSVEQDEEVAKSCLSQ